jgi:hypothetical protein
MWPTSQFGSLTAPASETYLKFLGSSRQSLDFRGSVTPSNNWKCCQSFVRLFVCEIQQAIIVSQNEIPIEIWRVSWRTLMITFFINSSSLHISYQSSVNFGQPAYIVTSCSTIVLEHFLSIALDFLVYTTNLVKYVIISLARILSNSSVLLWKYQGFYWVVRPGIISHPFKVFTSNLFTVLKLGLSSRLPRTVFRSNSFEGLKSGGGRSKLTSG